MKTNNFLILFLLLIYFINTEARISIGGDIGSGGDLVNCSPSTLNNLVGLYSLDYIMTKPALISEQDDLFEADSIEESLYKIRKNISLKVPRLLPFYDNYIKLLKNEDHSKKRVWETTPYQLKEIDDENITSSVKIPENCKINGKVQLIQAVVRQNPKFTGANKIVYKYMPKVFERIEKSKPLQFSFLLIHEWLWDFSKNVDQNRRVNRFFHTKKFLEMNAIEIANSLLSMGFDVTKVNRIVDSEGNGHFVSLQEALNQYFPGEQLIINPGVYYVNDVRINRDLELIGLTDPIKNLEKVKIFFEGRTPLKIYADNFRAKNLVFLSSDSDEGENFIEVKSGKSVFSHSVFYTSSFSNAIKIHSTAEITHNIFYPVNGIVLNNNSPVFIENNKFYGIPSKTQASAIVIDPLLTKLGPDNYVWVGIDNDIQFFKILNNKIRHFNTAFLLPYVEKRIAIKELQLPNSIIANNHMESCHSAFRYTWMSDAIDLGSDAVYNNRYNVTINSNRVMSSTNVINFEYRGEKVSQSILKKISDKTIQENLLNFKNNEFSNNKVVLKNSNSFYRKEEIETNILNEFINSNIFSGNKKTCIGICKK